MAGMYALVDYNEKAKNLCVGGVYNLRIFYFTKDKSMVGSEMYTPEKIEQLKKMMIPIIFKAKYGIPTECLKEPKTKIYFGRVKLV